MNPKKLVLIAFVLLFIFNINYLPLFLKVPYSFFNDDFYNMNFYSRKLNIIENGAGFLKKMPEVGFISDVKNEDVLLLSEPILNFYIAQYALVPAIVKKGSDFSYTIGIYDKVIRVEGGLSVHRQLSPDIFIFKRGGR